RTPDFHALQRGQRVKTTNAEVNHRNQAQVKGCFKALSEELVVRSDKAMSNFMKEKLDKDQDKVERCVRSVKRGQLPASRKMLQQDDCPAKQQPTTQAYEDESTNPSCGKEKARQSAQKDEPWLHIELYKFDGHGLNVSLPDAGGWR